MIPYLNLPVAGCWKSSDSRDGSNNSEWTTGITTCTQEELNHGLKSNTDKQQTKVLRIYFNNHYGQMHSLLEDVITIKVSLLVAIIDNMYLV
jgi:hypothetical protein